MKTCYWQMAVMLALLFNSCLVETEAYEPPYAGDRLIVNGWLQPDGVELDIRHTQNPNGIIGLQDTDTVAHAEVNLLDENDQMITRIEYAGKGKYSTAVALSPEKTYKIQVVAAAYPQVQSDALVIPASTFTIDSSWLTIQEDDFLRYNEVGFRIKDDGQSEEIYLFAPRPGGEDFLYTGLDDNYKSQCGILDDEGWTLWRDHCFNGQKVDLRIQIANNEPEPADTFSLRFGLSSEAFFAYLDRENQPDTGLEQLFGTPNPQASNINGGFGIIATLNVKTIMLTR